MKIPGLLLHISYKVKHVCSPTNMVSINFSPNILLVVTYILSKWKLTYFHYNQIKKEVNVTRKMYLLVQSTLLYNLCCACRRCRDITPTPSEKSILHLGDCKRKNVFNKFLEAFIFTL